MGKSNVLLWSAVVACLCLSSAALVAVRQRGVAIAGQTQPVGAVPVPPALKSVAAPQSLTVVSDVAEAAVQSVVNISTTKLTLKRVSRDEAFFRRLWGLGPAEREAEQTSSLGSGVLVSADGVVLTNNHVIEGANAIQVRLADGRDFRAELVGADPRSDIAVLRLAGKPEGLHPIALADSDRVRLGEVVLAIGSPFGLASSVSMGIVSAKGRADVNIADYEDFIQTDAAINPGNSGGALVNLRGELVGISTAIASSSGGNQGIGFAIPANMARPVMRSILQNGRMLRGWLGVGIQSLTPELRKNFAAPATSGVLITDVHAGSAGDKAGLQRGDVVLQVGAQAVDSAQHLRNAVGQAGAGAKVPVTVWRQGKHTVLQAVLAEAPDPRVQAQAPQAPAVPNPDAWVAGMKLADITPEVCAVRNLPPTLKGALVEAVQEDSAVAAAGVRAGDVVLEVDRQATPSVAQLCKLLHGDSATLLVWRDGRAAYLMARGLK